MSFRGEFTTSTNPKMVANIQYRETGRNASSVSYQVSIMLRMTHSSSYYGYNLYGRVNVGSGAAEVRFKDSSPRWNGSGWQGTWYFNVTASAGTGGGTLAASFTMWSTNASMNYTLSGKTVAVSTWNTAPTWNSDDCNINGIKQNAYIPETLGEVTIDIPALTDREQSDMWYDVYRYVNGSQNATIARPHKGQVGQRQTIKDNLSGIGQGAAIKYLIQAHDNNGGWANDIWSWTYTKNKLTHAGASVSNITFDSASFVVNISGASNTNGSSKFTYNITSSNLTLYNCSGLTGSTTITIHKSGTAPSGPHVIWDHIKNLFKNNTPKWLGSFALNVQTVNEYGSFGTSTITVSVDLRTAPNAAGTPNVGGATTVAGAAYYLPARGSFPVSWGAGSDKLGGPVRYDLLGSLNGGSYTTLASNITTTSYTVTLGNVSAKIPYKFRVVTKTDFDYTANSGERGIDLHYWNSPKIGIGIINRTATEVTVVVTSITDSSIANVAIATRKYIGKSGSAISFAGSPYTIRETGLTETQTYSIRIEVADNSGLANSTVVQTVAIAAYIPIFSVRKKGIGIGGFATDAHRFFVKGNAKIVGNLDIEGIINATRIIFPIIDERNNNPTPNNIVNHSITTFFNNQYGDGWRSGITVAGWSDDYQVWQLSAPSSTETRESLKFRTGRSATWQPWRELYHDGNLLPVKVLSLVADINSHTGHNVFVHKPSNPVGWPSQSGSHNGMAILSFNTHSGTYYTQLALSTADNRLLIRSNNAGSYGAWQSVYTTQHKPAWDDVQNKPTTYNWNYNSAEVNLNSYNVPGEWGVYRGHNYPEGGNIGVLEVKKYSGDWFVQIYRYCDSVGTSFTRTFTNANTWGPWVRHIISDHRDIYGFRHGGHYMHCNVSDGAKGIDWWACDVRLKSDIQALDEGSTFINKVERKRLSKRRHKKSVSALAIIKGIQHFSFSKRERGASEHIDCGYIAQQLEEINPEFVFKVEQPEYLEKVEEVDGELIRTETKNPNYYKEDNGLRSPRTSVILPFVTKAIQELSEEIELLKAEIKQLKANK